MKKAMIVAAVVSAWLGSRLIGLAQEHLEHGEHHEQGDHAEQQEQGGDLDGPATVTGEILDMACYVGHGAMGQDHKECASTCIKSGLPVGIKGQDGRTYLIIGEHKPLNEKLAPLAAETITVRGKHVERDGIRMITNAEVVE